MKYINYFHQHPIQKKILLFLSSFCVLLSFLCYVGTLCELYFNHSNQLFKTVLIPLSAIILVEIIRFFYKKERPFEREHFTPLIAHSKGKSFPSKHATSALIIALSTFQIHPILAAFMVLNAIIVGATRILSGIHDGVDVLGGYLLAILLSLFYLI